MGIIKNNARELIKGKAKKKKTQAKQTQEKHMICFIEVRFTKNLLLVDDSTTVFFQPFSLFPTSPRPIDHSFFVNQET